MFPSAPVRILAIDPGTRYMGVAVLAGSNLVYYGVRDFTDSRPAEELLRATRQAIEQLIRTYQPNVFAYERSFYAPSLNSALLRVQETELGRIGKAHGLTTVGYLPARVRLSLCGDGHATKATVAAILAIRFPELERYRTNGAAGLYWLHMFDAVAVGTTYLESARR